MQKGVENMNVVKQNVRGILLCLLLAVPAWLLGKWIPVVGGPVFAILAGMLLTLFLKDKTRWQPGVNFTSKKLLQAAVVLLGFGLNLKVVLETGRKSLPIILSTITTSLVIAFLLKKLLKVPSKSATLIGVGSSICGGSAIAATAPGHRRGRRGNRPVHIGHFPVQHRRRPDFPVARRAAGAVRRRGSACSRAPPSTTPPRSPPQRPPGTASTTATPWRRPPSSSSPGRWPSSPSHWCWPSCAPEGKEHGGGR